MKTDISLIEKLKQALININQQFLDKELLERIIQKRAPSYAISHLEALGVISIIKKNTIYLNRMYPTVYIAPEVLVGLYCKGDDWMIGGLGMYNHFGRTTQQAQRTIVYTTKTQGQKIIAGQRFLFYKRAASFFWGKVRKEKQGVKYYSMSRERACIQMIVDSQGILEFQEDVILQFKKGVLDRDLVSTLIQQHCSKSQQALLAPFLIAGSKK